MKKQNIRTIYISLLLGIQVLSFGQISLEATYTGAAGLSQIEDGVFRFYEYDIPNTSCIIYNEQHEQVKTINLNLTSSQYLYSITYVSIALFDADDEIELLYTFSQWFLADTVWYLKYTSKVINESGEILLDLPGAQYNTVTNTSQGSELLSWVYDYALGTDVIETNVYHLTGNYSTITSSNEVEKDFAWPNPCSQAIYLPTNGNDDFIKIYNNKGQVIDEMKSLDSNSPLKYNVNHLPSGLYYYQSIGDNKANKQIKFIIQ